MTADYEEIAKRVGEANLTRIISITDTGDSDGELYRNFRSSLKARDTSDMGPYMSRLWGMSRQIKFLHELDLFISSPNMSYMGAVLARLQETLRVDEVSGVSLFARDGVTTQASNINNLSYSALMWWNGVSPNRTVDPSISAMDVLTSEQSGLGLAERLDHILTEICKVIEVNHFILPITSPYPVNSPLFPKELKLVMKVLKSSKLTYMVFVSDISASVA